MKLLAAFLCVAAARKAPKKFESAIEMALDAPAIEASKDQLFCVAPPDAPAASLIFGSITWDIKKNQELPRDGPRRHEVDAPMHRSVAPAQRVQGARGTVSRVPGTDRSLRADPRPQGDRQEGVLPRGEDRVTSNK